MSFGIRPVGIYADEAVKNDPNLKGLDLTGIEILGEEWGKIDVEKAAGLRPDLIVADWWPAGSPPTTAYCARCTCATSTTSTT